VRTKKSSTKVVKKKPRNNYLSARSKLKKAASEKNHFYMNDGQVLKHFKELADVLETVADDTFYHHVNADRNDFANWIRSVFEEEELATKLEHAGNKDQARLVIYRFIAERLW